MIEKINDNVYKLDLLGEYNVKASSNVVDLSPFDVGEDLQTNPFQERGNDKNQVTKPSQRSTDPGGPITRVKTKKMKEALNGLIELISS